MDIGLVYIWFDLVGQENCFQKFFFLVHQEWILRCKQINTNYKYEYGQNLINGYYFILRRGVVSVVARGSGGTMATPDFGRSVNLISLGGEGGQIILAPSNFWTILHPWYGPRNKTKAIWKWLWLFLAKMIECNKIQCSNSWKMETS